MPPPLRRAALALVLALACGPFRWPAYGAAAPDRPAGILLLGTGTGGVYRSLDGGLDWERAAAGLPAGGVWAVHADPAGPDAAFASTGSLFHTADGGAHWLPVQGPRAAGPGFTALTTQGALVLAAGSTGILAGGARRRWVAESPAVPGGAPRALLAAGADLLYAVAADGRLYLHGNLSWSRGNDVWQPLDGLPAGAVSALADVPFTARSDYPCMTTDPCVELFAAVAGHGLWQSTDSGHTWSQELPERGALSPTSTISALLASTDNGQIAYAAVAGHGLYRTQHAGQFWEPAVGQPAGLTITALLALGDTILAATDGQGVGLYQEMGTSMIWRGWAHGLPAGLLGLSLAWLPPPPPSFQIAPRFPGPCEMHGFPVCGPFLRFYRAAHPSLLLFGNALGPPTYDVAEKGLIVQYFERARFEYRPNLPGKVRLTPLGRLLAAGARFPHAPPSGIALVRPVLFPQTGYSVGEPFLSFWRKHQGATLLGYPLSSLLLSPNGDGSGRIYVMQYFTNARLEYHPELPDPRFRIEPGMLGRLYLCQDLHVDQFCHT